MLLHVITIGTRRLVGDMDRAGSRFGVIARDCSAGKGSLILIMQLVTRIWNQATLGV